MQYKSKINIMWIFGGFIMLLGTLIVMKPFILGYYGIHYSIVQLGLLSIWIMDGLFIWIMLDRKFILKEDLLEIKYGCFLHLDLKYEDIKEFHEFKRMTFLNKYAIDAVAITFKPKGGKIGVDVIHIAPANIQSFIDHLKEKTMAIK